MNEQIRVRFAPSPTGPLHIGGVRTALYNYLFAKKNKGVMILRIEDTDQTRYIPGAESYIIESLRWCGIQFDESPVNSGPFAPYRQSERKEIYRKYADQLIEAGYAYYAFDTPVELEKARKEKESRKEIFQYDHSVRPLMKNSVSLGQEETERLINEGVPYVIRIRIPDEEEIVVDDIIRGMVMVRSMQLDDKVLYKADGMPTYHLANVVDDYLMKISHVIRGEEWLPSAPLHVLLYRYLGWSEVMPRFAHLPLLLKPDGAGKLSKRDGDRLGFPVFPLQWKDPFCGEISSGYREEGYFSEAVVNMLAMLGWNPGTEQELFTMNELIDEFLLERVGKSGSKFDPEKAKWFNHQYLQKRSNEEIAGQLRDILGEKEINASTEKVQKVCSTLRNRVNFVHEIFDQGLFFFKAPDSYDPKAIKEKWKPELVPSLEEIGTIISGIEPIDATVCKTAVSEFIQLNKLGMGQIMNALRLLLVGAASGPDLFEIIEIIGKEETLSRIQNGIKNLQG